MDGQAPRLRTERDVDGVTAELRGERLTVGQMLRARMIGGCPPPWPARAKASLQPGTTGS